MYEIALFSGLRRNELRMLKTNHLTEDGLILEPTWTKNRKAGFQFLPKILINKLNNFVKSGTALKLYNEFYSKKKQIPKNPLLYIPMRPSECLKQDLLRAGIPKNIIGSGKLDFHSFRVTYLTMLDKVNATVKQAQTLARHSTPVITYNTYIKTDDLGLKNVVEKMHKMCSDRVLKN